MSDYRISELSCVFIFIANWIYFKNSLTLTRYCITKKLGRNLVTNISLLLCKFGALQKCTYLVGPNMKDLNFRWFWPYGVWHFMLWQSCVWVASSDHLFKSTLGRCFSYCVAKLFIPRTLNTNYMSTVARDWPIMKSS